VAQSVTMACPIMAAMSQVLTAHAATSPGVSPAPRPRVAVPEAFARQGTSADEYQQWSTYMKAVKMTPPDNWADDNGRDVGFRSTITGFGFGGLLGFHVESCEFDPRGLQCILLLEGSAPCVGSMLLYLTSIIPAWWLGT